DAGQGAQSCGVDESAEAAAGGGDAGVDGGDVDGAGRRGVLESVVADELDHEGVAGGSISGAVEGVHVDLAVTVGDGLGEGCADVAAGDRADGVVLGAAEERRS